MAKFFQFEAWQLAGDTFVHGVPSSERGLSFISLVCLFVLCIVQKVKRRPRHLSKS